MPMVLKAVCKYEAYRYVLEKRCKLIEFELGLLTQLHKPY
jgi:hypothetical protein